MAEPELEKLLGGFAADTLTQEERELLFRAALHDQQLFNALADEQALKELLANPVVRRRLLQSLNRDAGRSRSWLDRFTRPAGLAWAGGVAVGVFAVVLGLKIYQESLRQAAGTAAVEEVRPIAPSTAPQAVPPVQSPLKDSENKESKAAPMPEAATKGTSSTMKSREQTATPRPRQEPAQEERPKPLLKEESNKTDQPVAALGKSAEPPAASSHQRLTQQPDVQILARESEEGTIGASARALFYGQGPVPDIAMRAQEKAVESAPKTDQFALARKKPQRSPAVKPLALRYSLVVEREGETSEVDAAFVANQAGPFTLTVESNQDGYVQIWRRAGDSLPELVLPAKETGRISLKTAAGQRQLVPIPPESDRLIVRLSRVPFGPITRQEAVMAGRGSVAQLTESASGTEQASYVANPDLSAAELAIEIPLGTKAAP